MLNRETRLIKWKIDAAWLLETEPGSLFSNDVEILPVVDVGPLLPSLRFYQLITGIFFNSRHDDRRSVSERRIKHSLLISLWLL